MALGDETPTERQERLERHEDLMQRREQRLANRSRPPVEGSKSIGHGFGEFFATLGDHKLMIFGGIGAVVVAIIVYNMIKNSNNQAATGGNQSPNYGAGGYVPSDISLSLDSINNQLSALGTQIGKQNGPLPPQPTPPPTTPVFFHWGTHDHTLKGIAQLSGISLARIEQLNPTLVPNKYYEENQRVIIGNA